MFILILFTGPEYVEILDKLGNAITNLYACPLSSETIA